MKQINKSLISVLVVLSGIFFSLNAAPKRIISLGAASTEILFELGAQKQIAAVSDVSNYPLEAKNLPKVGGFNGNTISIEKILSFSPDFIIAYKGMHDNLIPSFERYNINYYISDAQTIEDVITDIKTIGKITGHSEKADELEKSYRKILSELPQNKSTASVYWEIWNEPYMSAGNLSFINDVICKANGKNIFADVAQAYPVVSEETIIRKNPDFILLSSDSGINLQKVSQRKGWNNINAVKNNNIIVLDADIFTRPGPRIFNGINQLNKIFYEDK